MLVKVKAANNKSEGDNNNKKKKYGNNNKQRRPEPRSRQNKAVLKSECPLEIKHATAMKIVDELDNEMKLTIPEYLLMMIPKIS